MNVWVQRVVVAGSVGLAFGGWARQAHASGFAAAHFGGEHGSVVGTNPMALYYNPGAMGFIEGTDIMGDGELAIRHATWDHPKQPTNPGDAPLPVGADYANTGHASLTNVFGGPAVGATHRFGNLAVGAGFFVPFGGRVYWDKNPEATNPLYPRAADGVQRWHNINAQLQFIYLSLGAAYKLGPLSIGVGGNFIIEQVKTLQAHTLNNTVDSTSEGRAALDVSAFDWSLGAGAMLEALPNKLWIGASYQSRPGPFGAQILKGTLTYDNPGSPSTKYDVDFHQTLPDIFRAGVKFRASDVVELRLFGDVTRWSALQYQCVNLNKYGDDCKVYANGSDATIDPPAGPNKGSKNPGSVQANLIRNWKDTFGIRAGGSYWALPELELFAGAGFETAAAPDATIEPAAMDANNVLLALGGRYRITEMLYLAASYTHLYFFDRTVTNSQLNAVNGVEVRFPTQQQDGNGTYGQWVGVFDGNIEAKF
jgi:long-chain fatty acid transport protein